MRILIGADLVPTDTNFNLFQNGAGEELVGKELLELLQGADYRIFNLEVPLTDVAAPIPKNGPNLIAPENTIDGYKALGADCLTIANNHIMDQGEQGFLSTVQVLEKAGIHYVGGGETLKQASAPHVFTAGDKKIGIYACAEHEFSIASDRTPGANPFDPLESLDHIVELKKACDYLIVLYHGGKEHYRYPSPGLQKVCRKMVQKGADLVICQHSHCIGCEEKYLQGTIVYGQGNFLFDHSESEYWKTSLLVQISDDFKISYIPLVKKGNVVRLADGAREKEILDMFDQHSTEILQGGFLEKRYAAFSEEMLNSYLLAFLGMRRGLLYRVVNRMFRRKLDAWVLKRKYSEKKKNIIRNVVECEAHRELFLNGLKRY